jgi:predicted kinase
MPQLIIVTGLPCTGKTTLARRLAQYFDLPLIYKDAIKEALFDLFGSGSLSRSQALSRITYQVMFLMLAEYLAEGDSLVVESNFTRPEHARLFLDLKGEHPFEPLQVLCYARGEVLVERFRRRTRHTGHMDELLYKELEAELLGGRCRPVDIGGRLIEVDTSDFDKVDYDGLFNAVRVLKGNNI